MLRMCCADRAGQLTLPSWFAEQKLCVACIAEKCPLTTRAFCYHAITAQAGLTKIRVNSDARVVCRRRYFISANQCHTQLPQHPCLERRHCIFTLCLPAPVPWDATSEYMATGASS
jgi:hypothetical protein